MVSVSVSNLIIISESLQQRPQIFTTVIYELRFLEHLSNSNNRTAQIAHTVQGS